MRVPPYRERTRPELRRAMRWAQLALGLEGWTIDVEFDGAATEAYGGRADGGASVLHNFALRDATICVWLRDPVARDPLSCLFHEMGHLAAWPMSLESSVGMNAHWEQAADRLAALLGRLWQAEGRDE